MHQFLDNLMLNSSLFIIIGTIACGFFVLIKSADLLVSRTVILSLHWHLPRILISSTIISLGTTFPELSVSAFASWNGDPGLALGNAVGSVIADSTLILGISALIAPIIIDLKILKIQGSFQLFTIILLISFAFIFSFTKSRNPFISGGYLPQFVGIIFVGILICYIIYLLFNGKDKTHLLETKNILKEQTACKSIVIFLQLLFCIILVIASSAILIPAITEFARRFKIPESVIGATLVAFGTSLPELTTAIISSRKGFSDIAIGNIIGADILNILSVIGFSLTLTPKGFYVATPFYKLYFPVMLISVIIFQCAAYSQKQHVIGIKLGITLISIYTITTILSYFF